MNTNTVMKSLLAVAVAAFCGSAQAEEKPLKVFVLAGQSNMVGMRALVEELPEDLKGDNPNVLFFDGEKWIPLAAGKTEEKGFGPEITFAKKVQAAWGEPIGIIKLSKGGSMLATHWNPKKQGDSFYKQLLAKVEVARGSRPIEIVGMLWMQGESDAVNENRAGPYADNLKLLIDSLRAEFATPTMYFLAGRVNPPPDKYPQADTVRKAQEQCPAANYAYIDCDTLEKGPDGLHYNTRGYLEMGNRFADAMLKFMPKAP